MAASIDATWRPALPVVEAAGSFIAPTLFTAIYLLVRHRRAVTRRHQSRGNHNTSVSPLGVFSPSSMSPADIIRRGNVSDDEESDAMDVSAPLLRAAPEYRACDIESIINCTCDMESLESPRSLYTSDGSTRSSISGNSGIDLPVGDTGRLGTTRGMNFAFLIILLIFLGLTAICFAYTIILLIPQTVIKNGTGMPCESSRTVFILAFSRAHGTGLWFYYVLSLLQMYTIKVNWQLPGVLLSSITCDLATLTSYAIVRMSRNASTGSMKILDLPLGEDADTCIKSIFENILFPELLSRTLLAFLAFIIIANIFRLDHELKNQQARQTQTTPICTSPAHSSPTSPSCPPHSLHSPDSFSTLPTCPKHGARFQLPSVSADAGAELQSAPTTLRAISRHIWPYNSVYLQIQALLCISFLVLGRLVGVVLPYMYKMLIDQLIAAYPEHPSSETKEKLSLYSNALGTFLFLGYFALRLMNGGAGLINSLLSELWLPLAQHLTSEISLLVFGHLHRLSHSFHLSKNKAEILRIQERGVASIVALANAILFNVGPTLADILLAILFFIALFDFKFGLLVLMTMFSYLAITIHVTRIQQRHRRRANALENAMEAVAAETLANFETVKLFTAEEFESRRFGRAIAAYHAAEKKSSRTSALLSVIQNGVIHAGMMIGASLCLSRIQNNAMSVSDFILFLTYITQLYAPLNSFGSHYRLLQKNLVDMEKMLVLLSEKTEHVVAVSSATHEVPGASRSPLVQIPRDLFFVGAETSAATTTVTTRSSRSSRPRASPAVEFRDVCFSYDGRRPTLRNLTLTVEPAKTAAIVGPSGSGKSTLMRLLLRFYETQQGSVCVDGVDVRRWSVRALRDCIGVVPQDTVLFNQSIGYNVAYGSAACFSAYPESAAQTLARVQEVCRHAQIDDRVQAFPDKYDTVVGDRGMCLSGGEKQRVGIARMLIKNPRILFLDEATSSLDSCTERSLQSELRRVSEGRTSIIIAHRLSTIAHADVIYVMRDGTVVESGSHAQLMGNVSGVYHDMWMQQEEQKTDEEKGES